MGFLFITALIFLFLGICGLVGGFIMLSIGHLLARIDAFGITPFQGAVVCVGFAVVSAIILSQLLSSLFSPFSFLRDLFHMEDREYEEVDDFPVKRVRKQKKRR